MALYLEMNKCKRTDVKRIEDRLKEGIFVPYNKSFRIHWARQKVDVYANEIRKLAGLSGCAGGKTRNFC